MKIPQRVIVLWTAQDFITMGDNSRTQQLELSFLYATGLLNVLYLTVKHPEITLKGFRVTGRTRFNNYERQLQNGVS